MRIQLDLQMPEPQASTSSEKCLPIPVEDQVHHMIDLIESGHESGMEWSCINKFYRKLRAQKNPSERVQNLLKMISPVLSKYGYHGTDNESHTSKHEDK